MKNQIFTFMCTALMCTAFNITQGRTEKTIPTQTHPNPLLDLSEGEVQKHPPHSPPPQITSKRYPNSYINQPCHPSSGMPQPYSKYLQLINSAAFKGDYCNPRIVSPKVDVIMDFDAAHTADESEEREKARAVTMSTVSVAGEALFLPTPFDKTDMLRLRNASGWLGVYLLLRA